jgi:hypothetical protein
MPPPPPPADVIGVGVPKIEGLPVPYTPLFTSADPAPTVTG